MRPEMIEELAQLRRHWDVTAPADDLATRIVAHATQLPQHTPLRLRVLGILRNARASWNLALIPAGAIAAMLFLGTTDPHMAQLENDPTVDALLVDTMVDLDLLDDEEAH